MMEGDDIFIDCNANGKPSPSYEWYFQDMLSTNVSTLFLNKLNEGNSGIYLCVATNLGRTESTFTHVNVQCELIYMFY